MRKYSLWLGLNSTPSFSAFLMLSRICHLCMKERFYLELCELVIPLQTIHCVLILYWIMESVQYTKGFNLAIFVFILACTYRYIA